MRTTTKSGNQARIYYVARHVYFKVYNIFLLINTNFYTLLSHVVKVKHRLFPPSDNYSNIGAIGCIRQLHRGAVICTRFWLKQLIIPLGGVSSLPTTLAPRSFMNASCWPWAIWNLSKFPASTTGYWSSMRVLKNSNTCQQMISVFCAYCELTRWKSNK